MKSLTHRCHKMPENINSAKLTPLKAKTRIERERWIINPTAKLRAAPRQSRSDLSETTDHWMNIGWRLLINQGFLISQYIGDERWSCTWNVIWRPYSCLKIIIKTWNIYIYRERDVSHEWYQLGYIPLVRCFFFSLFFFFSLIWMNRPFMLHSTVFLFRHRVPFEQNRLLVWDARLIISLFLICQSGFPLPTSYLLYR